MSALPLDHQPLIWEYRILGGLTVEVPGAQTQNSMGEVLDAAPSEVTYDPIAAHPADPRELERMPGVDHTRDSQWFYTTSNSPPSGLGSASLGSSPLGGDNSIKTAGSRRPYVVQHQGRRYEIVATENYQAGGGVFRSLGQMIEVTA